jgi:hypothetical protein
MLVTIQWFNKIIKPLVELNIRLKLKVAKFQLNFVPVGIWSTKIIHIWLGTYKLLAG